MPDASMVFSTDYFKMYKNKLESLKKKGKIKIITILLDAKCAKKTKPILTKERERYPSKAIINQQISIKLINMAVIPEDRNNGRFKHDDV